jgi:diguanylate cyclase (GGDEF)-like protein
MFRRSSPQPQGHPAPDAYRGAQYDVIVRGSGFLSIVGATTALALAPFYPPTAQIGAAGWAIVVPLSLLGIALGSLSVMLRYRPSMASIHASAFTGAIQIGVLEWLAGGGKSPYLQLLLLPTLGAAANEPVRRCVRVLVLAGAVQFSPLLYSTIDVPQTVTEFALISVMTLMTAAIVGSTREHRARLKDAGEHANVLAHLDQLTGMPNRRAFDEALAEAIEHAELDPAASFALLLCDVDSFKQINDTFGHAAGDEALQAIAHALCDAVRKPDTAFRWAGDEFAVILRYSDELGANRAAARLRKAVTKQCQRPDGSRITIGTGVAALRPGMSAEEVLVEADRALFAHKSKHGRLRGAA